MSEQSATGEQLPAWQRETPGETRLFTSLAIALTIAVQLGLPDRFAFHPIWLLPAFETTLLVALIMANPFRIGRESTVLRIISLSLLGVIALANIWSASSLVWGLLHGAFGDDATQLFGSGGAIWSTNVIAFALLYWEFDRGGPAARAHGRKEFPDFLFVQMQSPEFAPPDWEPTFVDYLYTSFTNATAFSPTDTMPVSRWSKLTMLIQSVVSLVTVALVIARAVNILK